MCVCLLLAVSLLACHFVTKPYFWLLVFL
uniref:Uncharacterized protein n=1 Tax=Anguilla anguilla TaxID=7936 RepID=A0A0E9S819_ANGAN